MKKRIGTLKGKPIVEGGGSNIIKENEININDIGSSDSSNSNDDDISYFGLKEPELNYADLFIRIFPLSKLIDYGNNPVNIEIPAMGTRDFSYFCEFGGNINNKQIYLNGNWVSLKEVCEFDGIPIEILKPISKEDFYRTDYTQEEAEKIAQDYNNHYLQNAPSETK